MPLYEFKCTDCENIFERLMPYEGNIEEVTCKCGEKAEKLMSTFSHAVTGGSPTESIDMTIGRSADQRWQNYHDKHGRRRKNSGELQPVKMTKEKDGSYKPMKILGNKEEKNSRKEYSSALQEIKSDFAKKGQSQFDGPGEF